MKGMQNILNDIVWALTYSQHIPIYIFQTSKAISFSCPPCSSLEIPVIPYQSSTLRQRRLSYTSSLQHIHLPSRPPPFEPALVTCELWIQHWKPAIFNTSVHSPSKHRHPRPSPCKLITLPNSLHNQCKPHHPQDYPINMFQIMKLLTIIWNEPRTSWSSSSVYLPISILRVLVSQRRGTMFPTAVTHFCCCLSSSRSRPWTQHLCISYVIVGMLKTLLKTLLHLMRDRKARLLHALLPCIRHHHHQGGFRPILNTPRAPHLGVEGLYTSANRTDLCLPPMQNIPCATLPCLKKGARIQLQTDLRRRGS